MNPPVHSARANPTELSRYLFRLVDELRGVNSTAMSSCKREVLDGQDYVSAPLEALNYSIALIPKNLFMQKKCRIAMKYLRTFHVLGACTVSAIFVNAP